MKNEVRTVGYLSPTVVDYLVARNQAPTTAVVTVTDKAITHMLREDKDGKHIPADIIRALPDEIANPSAVLWDKRDPALLYVVDVPGDAKLVVRVNVKTKTRGRDDSRPSMVTNTVRIGELVELKTLRDKAIYDVIEGKI